MVEMKDKQIKEALKYLTKKLKHPHTITHRPKSDNDWLEIKNDGILRNSRMHGRYVNQYGRVVRL
jgi:hypothetical protein